MISYVCYKTLPETKGSSTLCNAILAPLMAIKHHKWLEPKSTAAAFKHNSFNSLNNSLIKHMFLIIPICQFWKKAGWCKTNLINNRIFIMNDYYKKTLVTMLCLWPNMILGLFIVTVICATLPASLKGKHFIQTILMHFLVFSFCL